MTTAAERYEARHPGTGCGEAQKQERGERLVFKEDQALHRRTMRTRGIVVPELPWLRDQSSKEGGAA